LNSLPGSWPFFGFDRKPYYYFAHIDVAVHEQPSGKRQGCLGEFQIVVLLDYNFPLELSLSDGRSSPRVGYRVGPCDCSNNLEFCCHRVTITSSFPSTSFSLNLTSPLGKFIFFPTKLAAMGNSRPPRSMSTARWIAFGRPKSIR